MTKYVMTHGTTSASIGEAVLAETFFDRMKGLLFTRPGTTALLLKGVDCIHTFFMGFIIDVLFVNNEFRVLSKYMGVRPWRICRGPRGSQALEAPSMAALFNTVKTGDIIRMAEVR